MNETHTDIKSRVFLISGGSSGVGKAINRTSQTWRQGRDYQQRCGEWKSCIKGYFGSYRQQQGEIGGRRTFPYSH